MIKNNDKVEAYQVSPQGPDEGWTHRDRGTVIANQYSGPLARVHGSKSVKWSMRSVLAVDSYMKGRNTIMSLTWMWLKACHL